MAGNTHQIRKNHATIWAALAAIGLCLISGQSPVSAATLDVDVYSPAPPLDESDIITLRALTSDEVLPDTGWQTFTTSLTVNEYDIEWDLISYNTYPVGIVLPVVTRAAKLEDIGPLPAGTYDVTATWTLYPSEPIGLPPNVFPPPLDGPRIGTYQFTVVPEPAALALVSTGVLLCVLRRR